MIDTIFDPLKSRRTVSLTDTHKTDGSVIGKLTFRQNLKFKKGLLYVYKIIIQLKRLSHKTEMVCWGLECREHN